MQTSLPTQHQPATLTASDATTVSMLTIDGMHCAACAPTIEAALRAVGGVLEGQVDGATHRARVRWRSAPLSVDTAQRMRSPFRQAA